MMSVTLSGALPMLAPLALSSYLATRSADAALEAFETEIDETVSERENMIIARFHTCFDQPETPLLTHHFKLSWKENQRRKDL
jgi:hypothetical protein